MRDNDAAYINHVEYLIRDIDEDCELTIFQKIDSLGFQIIPSKETLKQDIIKAVRRSHYKLNINIVFSKSVNIKNIISFWTCF